MINSTYNKKYLERGGVLNQQHTDWRASGTQLSNFRGGTGTGARDTGATGMTPIRDHMVEFLVKHKLINTSQHGFLKARSCLTNLLFFGRNYKVGR